MGKQKGASLAAKIAISKQEIAISKQASVGGLQSSIGGPQPPVRQPTCGVQAGQSCKPASRCTPAASTMPVVPGPMLHAAGGVGGLAMPPTATNSPGSSTKSLEESGDGSPAMAGVGSPEIELGAFGGGLDAAGENTRHRRRVKKKEQIDDELAA